jgi:deazaflavin-dependent oxidoreductase (nitroreductase family)
MGLLTPLAVRIGGLSWMPRLLPQVVAVDKTLQRVSRGRVSVLDVAGLPNLSLTVPGRKSGTPRTTPLLAVPHGDEWLVAGSYFGGPRMPVWVHNLRAADRAEITVKGNTTTVTRREVEGEERDRLWQVMLATWPNYAKYEQRTDRRIPVFVLTPVG